MDENANPPAVRLLEDRPVRGIGEGAAADVREHHDALHVELVHRAVKLVERRVGIVHRDRGEPEESPRVLLRERGVRVVGEPRDVGLGFSFDEVHVRCGEREDLGVDADPIHVLQALRDIGHRRRHAEESRALVPDDPLAGRAGPEGEVAAASLDALEIRGRVVVGVKVEPHGRSLADPPVKAAKAMAAPGGSSPAPGRRCRSCSTRRR